MLSNTGKERQAEFRKLLKEYYSQLPLVSSRDDICERRLTAFFHMTIIAQHEGQMPWALSFYELIFDSFLYDEGSKSAKNDYLFHLIDISQRLERYIPNELETFYLKGIEVLRQLLQG